MQHLTDTQERGRSCQSLQTTIWQGFQPIDVYSCSDELPPSGTPCRRSTWTRGPESLAFLVDHRRNWDCNTSLACSELVLTVQVYVSSPSFYTSSICPTHTFSKILWNIVSRISNPQKIGLQGDLLQSIPSLTNLPRHFPQILWNRAHNADIQSRSKA